MGATPRHGTQCASPRRGKHCASPRRGRVSSPSSGNTAPNERFAGQVAPSVEPLLGRRDRWQLQDLQFRHNVQKKAQIDDFGLGSRAAEIIRAADSVGDGEPTISNDELLNHKSRLATFYRETNAGQQRSARRTAARREAKEAEHCAVWVRL